MTYIGKVYKLWLDAVERYVADRARRYAKYESGGESSSSTGRKGDDSAKAEADVASDPLSRPVNLTEADALLTARWKKQGRYWVWCPLWEMNEGGQPLLRADIMKADVSVQGYEVDIGRQDDVADVSLLVMLSVLRTAPGICTDRYPGSGGPDSQLTG
jgi:hypothetical protein